MHVMVNPEVFGERVDMSNDLGAIIVKKHTHYNQSNIRAFFTAESVFT